MSKLKWGVILSMLLTVSQALGLELKKIEVTKIIDGDTIRAVIDGQEQKIRFVGIDCLETKAISRAYKQAYKNNMQVQEVTQIGRESTQILSDLLNKNKDNIYFAAAHSPKYDRYGRLLGIIYIVHNVNQYMLQYGKCLEYLK